MRRVVAAVLVSAAVTCPAFARNDPPPAGLPLPAGLRLIDARKGTSSTAYAWTATYATRRPARDMAAYAALVERRGHTAISGPGVNLTFRFRRWQAFACADRGCAAPKGRFTLVLAIPGG